MRCVEIAVHRGSQKLHQNGAIEVSHGGAEVELGNDSQEDSTTIDQATSQLKPDNGRRTGNQLSIRTFFRIRVVYGDGDQCCSESFMTTSFGRQDGKVSTTVWRSVRVATEGIPESLGLPFALAISPTHEESV